jgi:hypothetical protein
VYYWGKDKDEGHWQFSLWDNIPLGPRGLQIAIIYAGNVLKAACRIDI